MLLQAEFVKRSPLHSALGLGLQGKGVTWVDGRWWRELQFSEAEANPEAPKADYSVVNQVLLEGGSRHISMSTMGGK